MTHYHVRRHAEDDEFLVATDIGMAMSYAADELGRVAQWEHELIGINGEAGLFEDAYRAWERSERYHSAVENAANIAAQYAAADNENDRAPLYQGPGWRERLAVAAEHTMAEVNRNSPDGFEVAACMVGADCWALAELGED